VEGISGKQLDVEINARIFSPKGELVTETKGMAPKKINWLLLKFRFR